MVKVPVVTPWLSSHWVRLVTRAQWSVAREVVLGLGSDLLSQSHTYWTRIGLLNCCSFDEAARRALEAERSMPADISGIWRGVEDGVRRWRGGG